MSRELPAGVKQLTVWLLLGVMVFLGVQWWQHRAAQTRFRLVGETVELRRGPDGHYHWPGRINGREVDFLVDTGATGTAISATLARELELVPLGSVRSNTAGGSVTGQLMRADIELRGGIAVQRLRVVALTGLGDNPLLGMDVLGKLRWEQRGAVLRIQPDPAD